MAASGLVNLSGLLDDAKCFTTAGAMSRAMTEPG
jgi:hypothetical protein